MNSTVPQINLIMAWLWVVAGFASGLYLGLNFQAPDWLGGYASFKRRLYRLAHISFFGLAFVNLMFFLTARDWPISPAVQWASMSFLIGAVTMPLCCVLVAHREKLRMLFAVPVLSLLFGGVLTLLKVIRL
ncbi:MAG: hypothetical protein AB1813_22005 [Verrucomicrobiota bacterium]